MNLELLLQNYPELTEKQGKSLLNKTANAYTKKKFDEKFNDFIVQNYKKEVTDVKIKNNMLLYFEDEAIKSGNIIEYTRKKQCSLSTF